MHGPFRSRVSWNFLKAWYFCFDSEFIAFDVVSTSVFVLADTLLRSPGTLFILIVKSDM